MPDIKKTNSLPSINNLGNPISFLSDLIKSLIGFGALIQEAVDIITTTLKDVEKELKVLLKQELKTIVSCGVDPSLPSFIKSTGSGIVIEVKKSDFFNMLLIDPNSVGGKLMYNDVTSVLTDSKDFNTFLYGVIQNDGVTYSWNNILDVTFNSIKLGFPNNTLTIKATSNYDNKKLTDLNNNFIDSLTLFNTEDIVNRIIDTIFGSISLTVGKTARQIEAEEKINDVIDKISNSDSESEAVSDTLFEFSNEEVFQHQEKADFRKKGIVKLECCNKISASIPVAMLTNFNTELSAATTTSEQRKVVSNNLTKMANQTAANSKDSSDNLTIKLNFIQNIIDTLIKAIVGILLSPKIILIFIINFKIMYGLAADFDDPIEFMKKNKVLIKKIVKKVTEAIVKKLLTIALKEISSLVAAAVIKKQIEKAKTKAMQILSLAGASQEVIRKINGL